MKISYYLTAACVLCDSPMRVLPNRRGTSFLGCTKYPRCRFTAPYEPVLTEAKEKLENLDTELKALLFAAHPDRWPEDAKTMAGELTIRLNDLREKLS